MDEADETIADICDDNIRDFEKDVMDKRLVELETSILDRLVKYDEMSKTKLRVAIH